MRRSQGGASLWRLQAWLGGYVPKPDSRRAHICDKMRHINMGLIP